MECAKICEEFITSTHPLQILKKPPFSLLLVVDFHAFLGLSIHENYPINILFKCMKCGMIFLPCGLHSAGSPVIKSTEICIQGAFGIGFGINFPAGISGNDFPL